MAMVLADLGIDVQKERMLYLQSLVRLDLDYDLLAKLRDHLQLELDRDYTPRLRRKGQKLYPHSIVSASLDGEDARAEVKDGQEIFHITMTLPVFDWDGGFSYTACSCTDSLASLDASRCHHMWVAQKAFLDRSSDLLASHEKPANESGQASASVIEQLAKYSESISGSNEDADLSGNGAHEFSDETFDHSRRSLALKTRLANAHEMRFIFQWNKDGFIQPLVQKLRNESTYKFEPITWKRYLEFRVKWKDPVYQMLVAHLEAYVASSGKIDYQVHTVGLLRNLIGTGLVYDGSSLQDLSAENVFFEPLELVEASLTLTGRLQDNRLILIPTLEGLAVSQVFDDLSGAVAFDRKKLCFTALDPKTSQFVSQLIHHQQGVDISQRELMLNYLTRIEKKMPISLDAEIVDDVRSASQQIFLRITPFEKGDARIELLCRPALGTDYFPPASGPERVLQVADNEKSILLERDFFTERDRAIMLYEQLCLRHYKQVSANSWILRDVEQLLDVLSMLERCAVSGLVVEWPQSIDLKPSIEKAPDIGLQPVSLSVGEKKDWFSVSGSISHDGSEVDLGKLLEALRKNRRYIQLRDGRWALISQSLKERLQALEDCLDCDDNGIIMSPAVLEKIEQMREQEGLYIEAACDRWRQMSSSLHSIKGINLSLPINLQAELRPYQVDGFRWMSRLYQRSLGACLADDMGLGKTVQTLAVLLKHADRGPSLVVAPSSLASNWRRECERFCPTLKTHVYRDTDRSLQTMQSFRSGDIILASYGLILRDEKLFQQRHWNIIVLDEAQAIKNARSKTARSLQSINARWFLALTGTPIENHLGDLWSLFRTISPGLLGPWERFRRTYAMPMKFGDSDKISHRLKTRIGPFILRRMKQDFLKELPPKTVVDLRLNLNSEEKRLYNAIRMEALEKAEQLLQQEKQSEQLPPLGTEKTESLQDSEKSNQRFSVLASLTRLRLLCLHGRLVDPAWNFESTKLKTAQSLLLEGYQNQRKILVFSQFTSVLQLLRTWLHTSRLAYSYLDGSVPVKERERQVQLFQSGNVDVFLISLKAGGSGLNLTKADVVIHLDPWWNPAVQEQATDRAYRIGQVNPVTVYHLIAEGTVEERMHELQNEKRQLAGDILQVSRGVEGMKQSDLIDLIKGN